MKKMMVNPDKEYEKEIRQAIKNNDGYCPCVITKSDDTKCPCKKFREDKICCCDLYVEVK